MDTPLDEKIAKLKERIQRQRKDMEDIRASLAVLMASDVYGDHMDSINNKLSDIEAGIDKLKKVKP